MSYYGLIAPKDGFPRAQAAAERATALDPDLADAHGTLALGALFHRRNWPEAEQHFRRSIALNAKLATVRAFFAIFLATLGRHDESIAQARTGRDLDPLSPLVNMSVGWALYFAGRLEESIAELLHTRDLHRGQNADEPHSVMMVSYELLDRYEEAAQTAMNHACFGVPVDGQALLSAWRSGGAPAYWLERLAALDRAAPTATPMIHFNYACVLIRLGRADEAMAHLTALADGQQGSVIFLAVDPSLAPLRERADFDALLTRIGVPRPPRASAPHRASR
jgi:serine/threonine-protein kinase